MAKFNDPYDDRIAKLETRMDKMYTSGSDFDESSGVGFQRTPSGRWRIWGHLFWAKNRTPIMVTAIIILERAIEFYLRSH